MISKLCFFCRPKLRQNIDSRISGSHSLISGSSFGALVFITLVEIAAMEAVEEGQTLLAVRIWESRALFLIMART